MRNGNKILMISIMSMFFLAPIVMAQEPGSSETSIEISGDTILDHTFAEKLEDPEVYWPTIESIEQASIVAPPANPGRQPFDGVKWLTHRALVAMIDADYLYEGFGAGNNNPDTWRDYEVAVSPSGYESVYHRWEVNGVSIQMRSTRARLQLVVVPWEFARESEEVSRGQVIDRSRWIIAEFLNEGSLLLGHSDLNAEAAEYGYLITPKQSLEQYESLRAAHREIEEANRREAGYHPSCIMWLRTLRIRTDGKGFVIDLMKDLCQAVMIVHLDTKQWWSIPPKEVVLPEEEEDPNELVPSIFGGRMVPRKMPPRTGPRNVPRPGIPAEPPRNQNENGE